MEVMKDHRDLEFQESSEGEDEFTRNLSTKDTVAPQYEEKPGLRVLQFSLFATIMEDAITQIRLLENCNNELRILRINCDRSMHINKKFGIREADNIDELAGIDVKNLKCDKYKLDKLAADRKLVYTLLESTYLDLAIKKCFESLSNYSKSVIARENFYKELGAEEAANKNVRRELLRQMRQQRTRFKTVIYDTDMIIDNLKGDVEDALLISETRGRYVDNWQIARTEQNTKQIADKESVYTKTIEYYRERADHEARVHTEIETLTNININETLEKVEEWMDKYDLDTDEIDLRLQIMKSNYQTTMEKRISMEQMYEFHDQEMKEWTKFKDDREAARLYTLKMSSAATVVQAWWRGLLVRLQIGPYKQKKAPKKKKPRF